VKKWREALKLKT